MAGDITLERSLPHSEEAERAVLGAILVENTALNSALERLEPQDFYREGHQRIFRALIQLSDRGVSLDPITLSEELGRQGGLEQVGGMAYLASLMDGVPVGLNVEHHAEIVKEKATLRALVSSSNRVIHNALRESVSTPELLEEAQRSLFEISQGNLHGGFLPVGEILDGTMPHLEKREALLTGMATGYELLDEYTSGLQPGELIILAARPGLGKTSLALNIAQNLATAEPRRTVGIFSLEMTREQLVMRLICSEARVDHHRLRRGYLSDPDWERIMTALEKLSPAPIYIDDTPGITPMEMQAKARRLKSEMGLDPLIVDYIQLMHVKGFENRTLEIASISRSLKALSKELGIPVLAISQLSRAIESRSDDRPRLSDLRESGSLEQDSDVVMFINRKPPHLATQDERGVAEIIVAKQRNGPTGSFELAFLEPFTRFENLAVVEGP